MRDIRWAWLGILTGALLGLLLFAPAVWLAARSSAASSGQVQALETRGTVWNGSARLVLSGGASSRDALVLPGRVVWQLRPQWMGMRLQLLADCCTVQPLQLAAVLQRDGWTLALADNTSQWPAQVLAGLGSPWNTVQPRGQLRLSAARLVIRIGFRASAGGRRCLARCAGAVLTAVHIAAGRQLPLASGRPWIGRPATIGTGDTGRQPSAFWPRTMEWGALELSRAG